MPLSTVPPRDPIARTPASLSAAAPDAVPHHSASTLSRRQNATLPMPLHHRPSPPPLAMPSSLPASRPGDLDRAAAPSPRLTYTSQVMPRLPTLGTPAPQAYVSAPAPYSRRFVQQSTRRVAIDSLLDARTHVEHVEASQSFLPPIQSRITPMRDSANMYNSQRNNIYHRAMRPGQENRIQRRRTAARVIPCPYENCNKTFSRNSNLKVHTRIHTGTYPFECDRCDRKFMWSSSLHWHTKWHEKQSPQHGNGSGRRCSCPCPVHDSASPVSQVSAEGGEGERTPSGRGATSPPSPARSAS